MFSDAPDEMQPWILVGKSQAPESTSNDGETSEMCCATWRLRDGSVAMSLFSSEALAREYADSISVTLEATAGTPVTRWEVLRPTPAVLARLMIQACKANILSAVVDPGANSAKKYFNLLELLRTLRTHLRTQAERGKR